MDTATDKQIAYLVALWESIAHPADDIAAVRNGTRILDKREASRLIDEARSAKVSAPRATPTVTEGFYATGKGKSMAIHKVVLSRQGRPYAKTLMPGGKKGRWTYAPGLVGTLTADDVLTPERAAEYGQTEREGWDGSLFVYCACCGAELDNAESRDRGIGPVCFRKYF